MYHSTQTKCKNKGHCAELGHSFIIEHHFSENNLFFCLSMVELPIYCEIISNIKK